MTVTLKKASVYAQALIEAASKSAPSSTRTISVYTTEKPSAIVEQATTELFKSVDESLALFEAGYALRATIGEANAKLGVDQMLTKVALLDKKISTLQAIKDTGAYGSIDEIDASLDARIDHMRANLGKSERGFGRGDDSVSVSLVKSGTDAASVLDDKLATFKRERDRCKDEITAINFSTRIEIPAEVETALRAQKLID